MFKCKEKIHFIGIGGVGMGGIAEVLINLGYKVSGSDCQNNAMTERLSNLGATIYLSHDASNVSDVDVVVVSSAIKKDNPEVLSAQKSRIPILQRAQMLAEIMRFKCGIAIAGTHGKTTTTSLVSSIIADAGLDPTFVIGGKLTGANVHARLGSGEYLVAEADESDASFLYLNPVYAVVTNIDEDHMETYNHDPLKLRQTFIDFLHHLPFYGKAVVCVDDETVREILPEVSRSISTYAIHHDADFKATQIHQNHLQTEFILQRTNKPSLPIKLNMAGEHNILNALAAIAMADEIGIDDGVICSALEKFQGVGRRMQYYGEFEFTAGRFALMDDYGHHPKELEMTIQAVRQAWPDRRLVLVFQPHRYSRTRDLYEDFISVLDNVDVLFLSEVHAAGEKPIPGADSKSLAHSIRQRGKLDPVFIEQPEDALKLLPNMLQDNDVVLTQGAGNITKLAVQLSQHFEKTE